MDASALISVIVPVYKVEKYLDRCVASIANQTYQNLEIILVDDGSPDNCPAMCDGWAAKDSRVKVIHKENGGLSDARNAGMDVAAGAYIAFVDSDDWIHSDYIRQLYWAAASHDADIAACDFRTVYEEMPDNGLPEAPSIQPCTPEQAIESMTNNSNFRAVAWNKLYRREVLGKDRYPKGRYHEDEFFTYRILDKARRLVYIDLPLYYYFQRPGSIMSSISSRHLDALDAYLERLELLRVKYPRLYRKDKVTFCIACVGFYRQALRQKEERGQMCRRIRNCRKQVRFTMGELRSLSLRDAVYALGSGRLIHPFCALMNLIGRN